MNYCEYTIVCHKISHTLFIINYSFFICFAFCEAFFVYISFLKYFSIISINLSNIHSLSNTVYGKRFFSDDHDNGS